MSGPSPNGPSLHELLADDAAGALTEAERRQFEPLLREAPADAREAYLRTASLVQVTCLEQDRRHFRRMPSNLRARLLEQGHQALARQSTSPVADIGAARERRRAVSTPAEASSTVAPRRGSMAAFGGWAVAACLAVALAANLLGPSAGMQPVGPTPDSRAALLADAATVTLPWSAGDERYGAVTGDVVWSDRTQSGFLRLAGMPVNDPARAQYQLWIIDPDRDSHPVDGGVFDVTSSGEVIIPVQARLSVDRPTTFAITLEKPGGVVVSAGPLLVVASAG
jgi:anti-sigma-K factor RskA